MAATPVDPLARLSEALTAPAGSRDQATRLTTLREHLEQYPGTIPVLCQTLLPTVAGSADSLLRRWVLELLHFGICVSTLTPEVKTNLATTALDTLSRLLVEHNTHTVKVVVQCFTGAYPLLFRAWIYDRNQRQNWETLTRAKAKIAEFVWGPNVPMGVKESAVKFIQKVIVVGTRGVQDPRLQNKNDPNIAMVPVDHPFISSQVLETEGTELLKALMGLVFQSSSPDIITSILNSWSLLARLRPTMVGALITPLFAWTPKALATHQPFQIRSIEKALRILIIHISRLPHAAAFIPQIRDALATQEQRMDKALREEKERKAAARAGIKRPASASALEHGGPSDAKRLKTEHGAVTPAPTPAGTPAVTINPAAAANFDYSQIPAPLVTELIIANLYAFTEPAFQGLAQAYLQTLGRTPVPPSSVAPTASSTPVPGPGPSTNQNQNQNATPPVRATPEPAVDLKVEPIDPLQMDMDDDEMEYEPDGLNNRLLPNGHPGDADDDALEDSAKMDLLLPIELAKFEMPAAQPLAPEDRNGLLHASLARIRASGEEVQAQPGAGAADVGNALTDVSLLLFVRTVTRGLARLPGSAEGEDADAEGVERKDEDVEREKMYQDELRQQLCDYVTSDFPARVQLASIWMNEEWYNDRIRSQADPDWRENYAPWLSQIVLTYQTQMDAKDRSFPQFLINLPSVPPEVLELLREWCVDPDRTRAGFNSLRDFVSHRPPLRPAALKILLDLTTHPDRNTRIPAINTVKQWVPDVQPMGDMIRQFALQMLRRLRRRKGPAAAAAMQGPNDGRGEGDKVVGEGEENNGGGAGEGEATGNSDDEDGQLPQDELVDTEYLAGELELPATASQIQQHVELLFSLCVKVPDFLDEIFSAYADMDDSVQIMIGELITPLIKTLGSSHGKLLALMRTFPAGSESLALRVLKIFTEYGRPSAALVSLVKGLISERDLDARFLIPIIAEMDKADITRHLPRIASLLSGASKQEDKNLVRSVFEAIVTTPPQTFGSVTSNLPRVRQSELLTPAELMVLLHESEKEIGLKATIEAIGICFSMTDVYRSEILAVVMQQIVDEPTLPVLFMRTVIQAVTTYKSLIGFVSTTLLSRLITKKIWTNPPLWEGFIRCAKAIAPASFGALLQLPKEQLRDLVDKQPSLKAGLRDYVLKKAGNKARVSGFLDIFGDDTPTTDEGGAPAVPQPQVVTAASA